MLRVVERGVGCRPAVAVVALQAQARLPAEGRAVDPLQAGPAVASLRGVVPRVQAGDGLDDAGLGVDTANGVGPLAGDVDVAAVIDRDAAGRVELGFQGRTAVAATACAARACNASDYAGLVVDASVGLVQQVREVEVAMVVQRKVVRAVEPGVDGRATVAPAAGHAVAGEGVQDAVAVDAPEPVAFVVGDDKVAVRPPHDAQRPPGVRVLGRDAVAITSAGDGGDGAGGQGGEQAHGPIDPRQIRFGFWWLARRSPSTSLQVTALLFRGVQRKRRDRRTAMRPYAMTPAVVPRGPVRTRGHKGLRTSGNPPLRTPLSVPRTPNLFCLLAGQC